MLRTASLPIRFVPAGDRNAPCAKRSANPSKSPASSRSQYAMINPRIAVVPSIPSSWREHRIRVRTLERHHRDRGVIAEGLAIEEALELTQDLGQHVVAPGALHRALDAFIAEERPVAAAGFVDTIGQHHEEVTRG